MRKDHRVDFLRSTTETFIFRTYVLFSSLKQSAVQQQPNRIGFNQMLAASDFSGCTQESDFHEGGIRNNCCSLMDFGGETLLFFTSLWANVQKSSVFF
jgi:hypothetical protein